jgi:chromate reductase, NAD(P)H dehydrogenase (quinone)
VIVIGNKEVRGSKPKQSFTVSEHQSLRKENCYFYNQSHTMKILVLPGSLRKNSSSNRVLQFIREHVTACSLPVFPIESLPHFDDPEETPEAVQLFLREIRSSDGILICTPEYAFGIPGALKNALDWTVGTGDLNGKPVGLITASSNGEKGHAAMQLVLQALGATIPAGASMLIPSVRAQLNPDGSIRNDATKAQLINTVETLLKSCRDVL